MHCCIINRQNVVIKIPHKALEGIRTAKIIEGKTNKIPHKALEGISTAKISNIYINNSIRSDLPNIKLKICEQKRTQYFVSLIFFFFFAHIQNGQYYQRNI